MGATACLILMLLATVLSVIFLYAFITGQKEFGPMMQPLNSPMGECYAAGSKLLAMIHYTYRGKRDIKMLRNCRIVYGARYAEYYYRVNMAQKVSVGMLTLIAGIIISVIGNSVVILGVALLAAFGLVYYFSTVITDEINRRATSIEQDFPEMLSKLALLVNAGMIVKEAWEKISENGDGVLYKEMRTAVIDMQNGVTEMDAIIEFAERCGNDDVTKFSSTLVQNLSKGSRELVEFLKQFSGEIWMKKKQNARKKGEEASGKLMIPIALMFLGLLVMLVVPIFAGMSF